MLVFFQPPISPVFVDRFGWGFRRWVSFGLRYILPLQMTRPQQGVLVVGTLRHPGGIWGQFGGLQTTSPNKQRQTEHAPTSDVNSPWRTFRPSNRQSSVEIRSFSGFSGGILGAVRVPSMVFWGLVIRGTPVPVVMSMPVVWKILS